MTKHKTLLLLNRKSRELTREKAKEFQEKLEITLDMEALAKEFVVDISESQFFDQDPQASIDDTLEKTKMWLVKCLN